MSLKVYNHSWMNRGFWKLIGVNDPSYSSNLLFRIEMEVTFLDVLGWICIVIVVIEVFVHFELNIDYSMVHPGV